MLSFLKKLRRQNFLYTESVIYNDDSYSTAKVDKLYYKNNYSTPFMLSTVYNLSKTVFE